MLIWKCDLAHSSESEILLGMCRYHEKKIIRTFLFEFLLERVFRESTTHSEDVKWTIYITTSTY